MVRSNIVHARLVPALQQPLIKREHVKIKAEPGLVVKKQTRPVKRESRKTEGETQKGVKIKNEASKIIQKAVKIKGEASAKNNKKGKKLSVREARDKRLLKERRFQIPRKIFARVVTDIQCSLQGKGDVGRIWTLNPEAMDALQTAAEAFITSSFRDATLARVTNDRERSTTLLRDLRMGMAMDKTSAGRRS